MTSNAILVSKFRCHGLASLDEASLVTIQATLAMRPVMPSIQAYPANLVGYQVFVKVIWIVQVSCCEMLFCYKVTPSGPRSSR